MVKIEIERKKIPVELERRKSVCVASVVRTYVAGENIHAGQIVKYHEGKIFVKKANETTFFDIVGIAMNAGQTNDYINVLIKGVETIEINASTGLLFLNNDGYVTNVFEGNHLVVCGYKFEPNQILIFETKDFYIFEDKL